jgi:hypothetical protein
MLQSPERPARIATEVASPELVLVDGLLGARARAGLSEPDDTLSRLERDIAFRRLAARTSPLDDDVLAPRRARELVPATSSVRSLRRRRRMPLVATGIAATFAAAVLLGVQVSLRGNPAGAESLEAPQTTASPVTTGSQPATTRPAPTQPATTQPATTQPATTQPPVSVGRQPKPRAPRLFAWAPAPGATGYHVELFRDDELIYSSEVAAPHLELAPRWRFRSRMQTLGPGAYRWYVWPVRSGRRDAQATVQTELSVP